ncbi:MAG: hypothetical protein AAFX06_04460, partial [Planctomycetota bacterium]
ASASPVTRRKKPSQWPYHAVSAGVLLAVVAGVFLYNRNGGGRRAAEADERVLGSQTPSDRATTTRRTSEQRQPQPQARKKTTRPSGLGLGSDGKFADVLSEIESAKDNAAGTPKGSPAAPGTFQPLGGRPYSKAKKLTADDWPADLKPVAEFPSSLKTRFDCSNGWGWFDAKEDRLTVKTIKRNSSRWVKDPEFVFAAQSAVSLRTSIVNSTHESRVGFSISGIRVGLRPRDGAVQVYLRDRGKNVAEEVIHTIKSKSPLRLVLYREPSDAQKLCWIVGEVKEDGVIFGGEITIDDFPEKPAFSWYVTAPRKPPSKPFWIANLMLRD